MNYENGGWKALISRQLRANMRLQILRNEVYSMNVKQPLFCEILQNGIDVLGLSCTLSDLHDTKFKDYGRLYCEKLLIGAYNTTVDKHRGPISTLAYAYASGTFCRFLVDFSEEENPHVKFNNTIHLISRNPFLNDDKLIGMLLNCDGDNVKEKYCQCRDLIVEETLRLCRKKEIILKMDGKIEDVMTVFYALFVLGAHTEVLKVFDKK